MLKPKIAIVTTSRAEFGLLCPLIKVLAKSNEYVFELYVTGNHLCEFQGNTIKEIEDEGIIISQTIEIIHHGDSAFAKAKTSANAMSKFSELFSKRNPDLVIIMGDRYELLGIAGAAALMSIPIAHFSGGEITEGVIDDAVRHAITKLSQLHFVSNSVHYDRLLQLGESPSSVHNVGEPGLDNIVNESLLEIQALQSSLDFKLEKPFCIFTFHPVPNDEELSPKQQLEVVLSALEVLVYKYKIIITSPNSDEGGESLLPLLTDFQLKNKDSVLFIKSLGFKRYLSALKLCDFVIGNSSSGLIEAPSFFKPAINIGCRQKGRLRGENIIDVAVNKDAILAGVAQSQLSDFKQTLTGSENPYGRGDTVGQVLRILGNIDWPINCRKPFFDLGKL